ncbi:MAG: hypothetical protein WCX28_03245 [Bacteriovoracaceae bacterium]|nr:hypothetical protein [Bacteroidota bacterium]
MLENSKIVALIYAAVSSITVLVMLTTSFALFNQKYLPSFMLAQKYALPLIVSAMALMFLAFFEPERLKQQRTVTVMRIVMTLTFGIFTYYLVTLNAADEELATLIVFASQWLATLFTTIYFFTLKNSEAAG